MLRTLNTQIEALAGPASPTSSTSTPTPTIFTSPAPLRHASAPPGCSPRSATPAAGSPPRDSLACLAGVAPSTRQSGKVKAVTFRWGADNQLRDALCDFAGDSRHANPWAADLYHRASARGHDHPHAVRILGPRLGEHHLALLARRPPLRPRPAQALQRILNTKSRSA